MSTESTRARLDQCRLIQLESHQDSRGLICVTNAHAFQFPFARVFTLTATPEGRERGNHAHRSCHQLITCLTGSVEIALDDGERSRTVILNDPRQALYLPPMVWIVLRNFSPGAVVQVIASHAYDASEHVTAYAEFVALARN